MTLIIFGFNGNRNRTCQLSRTDFLVSWAEVCHMEKNLNIPNERHIIACLADSSLFCHSLLLFIYLYIFIAWFESTFESFIYKADSKLSTAHWSQYADLCLWNLLWWLQAKARSVKITISYLIEVLPKDPGQLDI